MGEYHPSTGVAPWTVKPNYSTYKSPYGPKYSVQPNFHGWTLQKSMRLGMTLGAFGGVAGFFALYFFSAVPRVRKDIIQKIPIVGDHFVKEIPPSDNACMTTVFGCNADLGFSDHKLSLSGSSERFYKNHNADNE